MKQQFKTILFASMTIMMTILLIKYPDQSLNASIHGLHMWWEVVFPSLLPFFIIAELLIGFGVVTFIGILFEPIMRPLFNVPGAGSFAWIMGMASGYPSGAKISVRLRERNELSKIEAERLLSFTNASSPLFIFAAISVGFFNDAKLGLLIAVCHYIGNALVGICMRFHGSSHTKNKRKKKKPKPTLVTAFKAMHKERLKDPRPFGEIIGDSILNSIKTLVMVGGFIILFSVLTKLLFLIGFTPFIAFIFQFLLQTLTLPIELSIPFISGIFEITQGAQLISQSSIDSTLAQMIVISFILGFNGFSVQAQVSSIIAKTDISFSPYFFARILHGIFASLLTVILYHPLYIQRKSFGSGEIPAMHDIEQNSWSMILQYLKQLGPIITITCLTIGLILLLRREVRQI